VSRDPSLSGLGRGRARGIRDIAESEQLAERRPGRFRVEDWEGELAGTQSDAESKWITTEYNAPSPHLGYKTATDNYDMCGRSLPNRRRRLPQRVWGQEHIKAAIIISKTVQDRTKVTITD